MSKEDELKQKVAQLELEICEKEKLIAANEAFVKGHANGFNVAKYQVIDMIRELPEVEANADSITVFLRKLTDIIGRVQGMEPMFKPKYDK